MVSNIGKLDVKNPLPLETGNLFTANSGKQYLPFLDPQDTFGQFLTEVKLLSSTTLSCVSSKAEYCLGKGWFLTNTEKDESLNEWGTAVNRKGQSLNDVLKAYFNSMFTSGNAYLEVVRGKIGSYRFVKVYHRPFSECRLSVPDDDDICNSVLISKSFLQKNIWTIDPTKVADVPLYSANLLDRPWWKDAKGNEHTIFHMKNDTDGNPYYGMPSNIGGLISSLLEYKHGRHNLDNLDNNLVIGGMITIKGAMTDDEARDLAKSIIKTHAGDGTTGRWIVNSSESGIPDGVQVDQFNVKTDSSFVEGDIHNENKIYVANRWNKLLIGGTDSKGLGQGNSSYIRSVFDIANNTVIIPEQQAIVEKFLRPLLRICDEWMGTKWSKHDIALRANMPVSFLGDISVNNILTVDEGREMIGKAPLGGEDGKKLIQAVKQTAAPQTNDNVQDQPTK
jgi:hypothetical protein